MDNQRLEEIATWLEGGAKHESITFDMAKGIFVRTNVEIPASEVDLTACSTSCCIAGAAVEFAHKDDVGYLHKLLDGGEVDRDAEGHDGYQGVWGIISHEAMELLDLDYDTANQLFRPDEYGNGPYGELEPYSDPAWAARVIRKLIATGEVDWAGTETA
jgi:hypothetical protein